MFEKHHKHEKRKGTKFSQPVHLGVGKCVLISCKSFSNKLLIRTIETWTINTHSHYVPSYLDYNCSICKVKYTSTAYVLEIFFRKGSNNWKILQYKEKKESNNTSSLKNLLLIGYPIRLNKTWTKATCIIINFKLQLQNIHFGRIKMFPHNQIKVNWL